MDFFKKKNQPSSPSSPNAPEGAVNGVAAGSGGEEPRDTRKAARFFQHAKTMAESSNFDYAIQLYLDGLRLDPETMSQHEALRDAAVRRKAAGGKAVGMFEGMKLPKCKTALDRLIRAEYLWAKDPSNPELALGVMDMAQQAGLGELAHWFGPIVLAGFRENKKPTTKSALVKMCDIYSALGDFVNAVESCRGAAMVDPKDEKLTDRLRVLEAERTVQQGQYDNDEGFKQSIRDESKQRSLMAEDNVAKTDEQVDQVLAKAKSEHEDAPDDVDRLLKYVRALRERESETNENTAIKVLLDAHERLGQYRFKKDVGDIRMKQYDRKLRELAAQHKAKPDDAAVSEAYKKLATEKLHFELAEFTDRVQNYPTDMALKFELGRRQYAMGDYDNAIANFQEAQQDAKYKAHSLRFLGLSFSAKKWFDEAVDTFRRGIEAHEIADDNLGLELRYELMNAIESKARHESNLELAQEANRLASQIAQVNFKFRDIRVRVDKIRKFIDELRAKQAQ